MRQFWEINQKYHTNKLDYTNIYITSLFFKRKKKETTHWDHCENFCMVIISSEHTVCTKQKGKILGHNTRKKSVILAISTLMGVKLYCALYVYR